MKKKESTSNNGQGHSPHNLLFKLVSQNYERKNIDSAMIATINSFVFNLGEDITKNTVTSSSDSIKLCIEILITFQANLADDSTRHTCSLQQILNFFTNLLLLLEKISVIWKDMDKFVHSELINILWFLLTGKGEDNRPPPSDKKMEALNFLVQNNQNSKFQRFNLDSMIRETFSLVSMVPDSKHQIKNLFTSFIMHSAQIFGFKSLMDKYLIQCLVSNHVIHFRKAIRIYQKIGVTFEERRLNVEEFAFKILDSNHSFNFVQEMNELYSFSKLFTSQTCLKGIVRTIDKIIERVPQNEYPIKVLQEISQHSIADIDGAIVDKFDLKFQAYLSRVIEWMVSKGYKKEQDHRQKVLQQAEQKEEKLIEFVKKLSSKVGMEEVESQKNEDLAKTCNLISKILKKLISHSKFKAKLANISLDTFPFLRSDKITNEAVKKFLIDIIPCLLHQFNLSFKEKTPLAYAIILRRAEIEAQSTPEIKRKVIQQYFNQTYFQLIHPDSLNYHFVLCFTFLKYLNEKETIADIVTEEIIKDLSKQGKNKLNRNLIINMSILLKVLHPVSSSLPVKFKIRQLIKNPDFLAQKLDINQIMIVCSKELGILRPSNYEVPRRCVDIQQKLNEQLENYTKDYVTTFYSLIIGISDIIQQSDSNLQDKSSLLVEIKYIRKISFLSQTFTLIRCFIEKVAEWKENGVIHQKNIPVFLLLTKLCLQLKNKATFEPLEDLDLFIETLKEYILTINDPVSLSLLVPTLNHFKNNKNQYKQDKFYEYLTNKNFIRFYSESIQDQNATHIILMRVALKLFKKAVQSKGQSFELVDDSIKTLFLLFLYEQSPSEFKFIDKHEQCLKSYLLLLMLSGKIDHKTELATVVQKLKENSSTIKQLVLRKHETNYINDFIKKVPFDFVEMCIKFITNFLKSYEKEDVELFRFVVFLVEDDKKDNCYCLHNLLRERLNSQLRKTFIQLVTRRIQLGLELDEKRKVQFLADSSSLYELLGHVFQKQQLLTLVEQIVQIDYYSQCDRSAFILKEIANIFSVVEEKNGPICETIFNYIITLAQIFPGQQKLEIATFICNFFGLSLLGNQEGNFDGLQKQLTLQCNNQCNYKCLKCDKLHCLACSVTCHKDHPVCYLSIPPEIKISRCQCRQIPGGCRFSKDSAGENRLPQNNRIKAQFQPSISNYPPAYLGGPNRQYLEKIKYVARPRADDPFNAQRFDYNHFIPDEEYDRMDQELAGHQRYYEMLKDEYVPRIGSRLDRIFDREEFPPQAYRIQIDQSRPPGLGNNPLLREKEKEKENMKEEQPEPQFIDETYEQNSLKMEIEDSSQIEQNQTILKKYALLPKFIDLMVNFCSKKVIKDKSIANLQLWSPAFTNPTIQRLMVITLKLCNPGSYHMEVRRQNPLNNVSCVLIKRNLAYNNRFLILATGTDLHVYSKERLLIIASQAKPQGFNPIHRHSVSYEIHSVEVSPSDKNLFCASGLHNLALFNISNDGGIGRTQNRYNVNNLYINKIKLTKMGIFVGVQKEIRVLNYTCKQILTIKPQEANTLVREWAIYQKAAGCQIYFVCPNGNIFFTDILPADEGRKQFTGRIMDHRKSKNSTGASVFVKDLPDIGKQIFASFKDGYNILGRLEGDQMQNMTDVRLKGVKVQKNIFDTFFIVGHVDLVKLQQIDDVFLVCTVKKYFPPEMAFHQGFLTVIRMKKDGNTDIQILNQQSTCESFQVFYVGTKHFFILSLHTDGSLHLNSPTKIPKMVIDEQLRKVRENQQGVAGNAAESQPDLIQKTRKSLEKQIKFEKIRTSNYNICYLFRENTENMKVGTQYILLKLSQNQYELKQVSFGKIITGISLPYFGTVELPTRRVQNVFEIGFTHTESLYFFANGVIKFKYFKNQAEKFTRENINLANNRALEKIQRMQRLSEYSQHERLINSSMMSNFLNIKQDTNLDIVFIGRSFENFKSKIGKFDDYFSIESDDESSSIEKTALIIKMFLTKGLKEGNFCEKQQILQLVENLTKIVAEVNKKLFKLLKDIIVIAMKVYEKQTNSRLNLYTEQNYGLRAATQSRLVHFYTLLKLDIGDQQFDELLELLNEILQEDIQLFSYYCAKYTGLLTQIYRRIKKADTSQRAQSLVKIYAVGYPILVYCDVSCGWIPTAITQTVYSFISFKSVRDSLFNGLKLSEYLNLQPELKGLGNKDNEAEDMELVKNVQQGMVEEEGKDPVAEIYMMFSRGQIDQDAMLRMIQDATKIQYEKAQEINQKPPEQNEDMQPQLQMEMEENIEEIDSRNILLYDLIDECTETLEGDFELVLSKIVTLYVVSKAVNSHFPDLTDHLLQRMQKMVTEIDIKCEGQRLTAILSYSCLFNRIITTNGRLKNGQCDGLRSYQQIKADINDKLIHIELEKVPKIKNPINLLPRIFKGEKQLPQAHVAYALVNLLHYPCEPTHVLLSLECYWLLPDSKQSYAKKKCESSIRDGINSGNLAKVYEIAKQNPEIWQQSSEYIDFIQQWIEEKRSNWDLALELLAIYYEN